MRTKFRQMANVTFVVNAQADALDSRRSAPAASTQSLYLGTITATAVTFTLGISSRLERVFY